MDEENTLRIAHQDGPQTLRLEKGGYSIDKGRLAISIETENVNAEGWPPVALFCIHNCPLERELRVGDVFECAGGMCSDDTDNDEVTHAAAYFTFHADEVYVRFTVTDIRDNSILFGFEAKHGDTDYYDERAKKSPTTGVFRLSPKPFKDLWIPS
jgi:hypothetical protein